MPRPHAPQPPAHPQPYDKLCAKLRELNALEGISGLLVRSRAKCEPAPRLWQRRMAWCSRCWPLWRVPATLLHVRDLLRLASHNPP
jgi:hypothetical protein